MKIAIGSDHRGFALKNALMQSLNDGSVLWVDKGCHSDERCDYPLFAQTVAQQVQSSTVDAGILICGSGIGMSIAANRLKNVYAALVWNVEVASLSKEHDNANILILPADFVSEQEAVACVDAWRGASFLGGRHEERLSLIDL